MRKVIFERAYRITIDATADEWREIIEALRRGAAALDGLSIDPASDVLAELADNLKTELVDQGVPGMT